MELYKDKLKEVHGYEEGKIDSIDPRSAKIALDYKKNFLKKFISINQFQIDNRLGGDRYYVTRKYDGEYAVIFFDRKNVVTINRSGRVRRGIPCIEEAGALLKAAGIKQAIIPAEIYLGDYKKGKLPVRELVSALADKRKISRLRLAVFDIVELNNKEYKPINYEETHRKLVEIFSKGKMCTPVDMKLARSSEEVKQVYNQWVNEELSEGLVVRSDLPFVYKVKPRHTIDVAIVGFTEGTGDLKGRVRTLLLALMPEKGQFQVVGKVGGGMIDVLKQKLFKQLSKKIIPSDYIEADSNHVAFHMVKPEVILEISVNDLIYETNSGLIQNPILKIVKNKYVLHATIDGASFIAPLFERVREDKKVDVDDLRMSQLESFSNSSSPDMEQETVVNKKLPKSKLISREIYKKELGSKIMVQKFLIWKTNKEQSGDYPAYVFFYSNFSTDRKEPLQREVYISDSKQQIMELKSISQEKNIKKGWYKLK